MAFSQKAGNRIDEAVNTWFFHGMSWPEWLDSRRAEPPESVPEEDPGGIWFTYNGKNYDLREREENVNALMGETPAGEMLVVEGHINPNTAYYGIFDTKTKAFVKDILGANLTWRDDDITTAVYTFHSGVYDYGGTLLEDLALEEGEFVYALSWLDDGRLSVEINGDGGRSLILDVDSK